MSKKNFRTDRLAKEEARKLISKVILDGGIDYVVFTTHSLKQMPRRKLITLDVLNVLKSADSKIFEEGELESGSYRYRLQTRTILVVVSFTPKGDKVIVVTAWRK